MISPGSSTSNFFSISMPQLELAISNTARFIRGYNIRVLIALVPPVAGFVKKNSTGLFSAPLCVCVKRKKLKRGSVSVMEFASSAMVVGLESLGTSSTTSVSELTFFIRLR